MLRPDEAKNEELDHKSSLSPLSITSYKTRDETGKLVKHLYHKGMYYLCFSYGLYAGTSNEVNRKIEFSLDGPFIVNYTIIQKFKTSSKVDAISSCHLFMFNDGSIEGFKFKNSNFVKVYGSNVVPKLDATSSPISNWLNASLDGLLYTCNNNMSYDSTSCKPSFKIHSFDFGNKLVEMFYAADGEIISFDFISRERLIHSKKYLGKPDVSFICLIKSEYNENLILEEYDCVKDHISPKGLKSNFSGGHRIYNLLPISNGEFCYMKIIYDHTVIVLTNTHIQIIKLGKEGFERTAFLNNIGLPKEEGFQFLKDSCDFMYEKSGISLTLYDTHANKYTAKVDQSLLEKRKVQNGLQWLREKIFKLSKHDLCDSVLQLPGKQYITLTRMNGIHFISNNHRGPRAEKVKGGPTYRNKVYLASQIVRNNGTDIDSLLMSGSFNSKRGFLEKKSLVYDEKIFKLSASIKLSLENVTDFWITDLMAGDENHFTYESMGSIYRNGELLMDGSYNYGVLVTRTGMILENNMDGSTSEIKQVGDLQFDSNISNMFCYSIENSTVRISTLQPQSSSLHKVKDVFIEGVDSKNSIISSCWDGDDIFYLAVYSEGKIFIWDTSQNKLISSRLDYSFIVFDILVKGSQFDSNAKNESNFVIASSYVGCVRVYKSNSNFLEVALEIYSSHSQKLEILDTPSDSPLVFLYNEKETIMLNLDSLTYGFIQLGVIPRKMRIHPKKPCFSLCVLDIESQINVFDFAATFDHGNFTKHMISLKPQVKNYMYHLSSVPLHLCTMPDNANQAVVCILDTNSGQYELMLFDYLLMKPISTFSLPKAKYSHAILKPFWSEDNSIYSSLRYFYGNKFIVCLGTDDKRTKFWLFEIRNSVIVQLYADCLEDRICSVCVYYEGSVVLFSGDSGIATYKIQMLKETSEVLEARSFPILESIESTGFLAYMTGDDLIQLNTIKGFIKTNLSISEAIEYPSEYSETVCMNFIDFSDITHVATKRISRKSVEPDNDYSENGKHSSLSRFSGLSQTERVYSGISYVATIDSDNTLAIYDDSNKSLVNEDRLIMPYLKIQLPDTIISLAPIPDGFQNLQICSGLDNERLEGVLPLFMICGTKGQIYIVSELFNESWMRSLRHYKKIKLNDERKALDSETNMRNVSGQYAVSTGPGINSSGFEGLGRNLKRRRVNYLPFKTIDFFDPAILRKVTKKRL
ncbi:hypothetical protein SEUBUCD646_0E00550 [Saccharomyces eubayanus]|uniref:Uncharacterized protein n=2 Tax=Saccharomyces TaxID=4930 RepID=A0A6C1E6K7_SACPS|nr:hypothetical protein GRS66_007019 [Saccharomyces pastorianus]CAI1943242.1 hypothetical protein SEUBUCD650_0E00560 [Saccharomyces eubayanus]CAI1973039.1 hypothetical protein SEUBUCD646_0E00550 [Saccharomyces eubayanus]